MTRPLVEQGVMSQVELLRLSRTVNELKGQIEEKTNAYREAASKELTQRSGELQELKQNILSSQDRVTRNVIRSPVHGIVKKINISTIGGVVSPGMTVVEITPLEDTLLILAKVKPRDIAFIHPKQRALVQITAYDFSVYGGLEGSVEYISPDTIVDDKADPRLDPANTSYYEVHIRTQKNHLVDRQGKKP